MEEIKNLINIIKSKDIVDIAIAVAVFVGFFLLSSIFAKIIMKCCKIKKEKNGKKTKIYGILKVIWTITGLYISILILSLPFEFMIIAKKIYKLILIFEMTRLIANLIQPTNKLINKVKLTRKEESSDENTMNFVIKFVRAIIYIIGAFIFISELGYDLSGLVTGLGIGSVVLALAAQDLAKNLFGGFAIITDKTFIVGDTIEVKGVYGVVEDITFRTTRIRKLDNTVITMPNSILADSDIINWNKIHKRRYDCNFKVAFDTNPNKINDVINKLKERLKQEDNVIEDSVRAYFSEIEKDGCNIKIYLYTPITDYDEYIAFVNDMNSLILGFIEKESLQIIYPTFSKK